MTLYHKLMKSPVGELKLVASDIGLVAVLWEGDAPERIKLDESTADNGHLILQETEKQLTEYFEKKRTDFSIELDFRGTAFQLQVWQALLRIPFSETRTYGDIAKEINNPQAVRAVGAAANKNPVSIIAPCHRVIGGTGKLIGFAGGLRNKSFLLRLEDSIKNPTLW